MGTMEEFKRRLDVSAAKPEGLECWRWVQSIRALYADIRDGLRSLEDDGYLIEVCPLASDGAGVYRATLLFKANSGAVEFVAITGSRYPSSAQGAVYLRCPGAPDFNLIPQYEEDKTVGRWYIQQAKRESWHWAEEEAVPLTYESLLGALAQLLKL